MFTNTCSQVRGQAHEQAEARAIPNPDLRGRYVLHYCHIAKTDDFERKCRLYREPYTCTGCPYKTEAPSLT